MVWVSCVFGCDITNHSDNSMCAISSWHDDGDGVKTFGNWTGIGILNRVVVCVHHTFIISIEV